MSVSIHARTHVRRALAPVLLALTASACRDATAPELEAPAQEARVSGTVVVESPTAGALLSGTVRFRARVAGASPSQYRMVWLVDGGQQNAMSEVVGAEEASVDVSTWSWRGAGPYRVTFRAFDAKGRRIGEAWVDVSVAQAAPPPPPPSGNPLADLPDSERYGFTVSDVEVTYRGVCPNCATA